MKKTCIRNGKGPRKSPLVPCVSLLWSAFLHLRAGPPLDWCLNSAAKRSAAEKCQLRSSWNPQVEISTHQVDGAKPSGNTEGTWQLDVDFTCDIFCIFIYDHIRIYKHHSVYQISIFKHLPSTLHAYHISMQNFDSELKQLRVPKVRHKNC